MAAMDLDESDVVDPHPDICALFCYYDALYFEESLGACSVSWSSRMTRCAGVCRYLPGGGCEIHLSEPLLKFRTTADVKNTLLHEMIHAYLWIKNNNKDHSQHGPSFQALMNKINSSSLIDHQKPAGGYNITIYHDFHNEVDNYRVHHWICEGCGDMIKRAINREPSGSDCIAHFRDNGSCGIPSCHWHNHKIICSGSYKKIAEPPGYKGKRKRAIVQDVPDDKSRPGDIISQKSKKSNSKTATKIQSSLGSMNTLTSFFPLASNETNIHSGSSSSENSKILEVKAVEPKMQALTQIPIIPKRPRTHVLTQKSKYVRNKRRKLDKEKDRCIVNSKWLGCYEDEETDEEIVPLINKRTERRKKLKLLENQKGRLAESKASDATQTTNQNTSISP